MYPKIGSAMARLLDNYISASNFKIIEYTSSDLTNDLEAKFCIQITEARNREDRKSQESAKSDHGEEESDDEITVHDLKGAEVMIHARGDCPIHPFQKTFKEKKLIENNENFCDKCFCYICDVK